MIICRFFALDETFDEARELALVEGRGDAKAASK